MVGHHHALLHYQRTKHSRKRQWMDRLIYLVVFAGPLVSLDQVWTIWIDRNIDGVSLATWSTFWISSVFWLFYGIKHREKPVILSSSLWIIIQGIIVLGIVLLR